MNEIYYKPKQLSSPLGFKGNYVKMKIFGTNYLSDESIEKLLIRVYEYSEKESLVPDYWRIIFNNFYLYGFQVRVIFPLKKDELPPIINRKSYSNVPDRNSVVDDGSLSTKRNWFLTQEGLATEKGCNYYVFTADLDEKKVLSPKEIEESLYQCYLFAEENFGYAGWRIIVEGEGIDTIHGFNIKVLIPKITGILPQFI